MRFPCNYDSKLLINKLEYILHIQGNNSLHSNSHVAIALAEAQRRHFTVLRS